MTTKIEIYNEDCLELMESIPDSSIQLIYIDPPFGIKADDKFKDNDYNSDEWDEPNDIDEIFNVERLQIDRRILRLLRYLYPRIKRMRDLLAEDGSIYVHCDYRVSGFLRLILDEVFGKANFKNEVVWWYKDPSGPTKGFYKRKHDSIFFYVKGRNYIFNIDDVRVPYSEGTLRQAKTGQKAFGRVVKIHEKGRLREDVWDIPIINSQALERVDYPTQKPESLIEIIIKASSNEGDLVADFFCGSGTTAAVCKKFRRNFIGCDISDKAIEIAQKRIKEIPNTLFD